MGKTCLEKLDNLAEAGYEGIEFWGGSLWERVDEIKKAAENHSVRPATICAGFRGCPLDADRKERETASSDIIRLLETAGELGLVGLIAVPIFGSPRLPDLSPYSDAVSLEKELLYKLCDAWGEAAAKANTLLLLEPLNRYETHLIRTLRQGVDVCEKVGNPHIKIMADFFHMSIEERDIPAAIRMAGPHIAHVHLAGQHKRTARLWAYRFSFGVRRPARHPLHRLHGLRMRQPRLRQTGGTKEIGGIYHRKFTVKPSDLCAAADRKSTRPFPSQTRAGTRARALRNYARSR